MDIRSNNRKTMQQRRCRNAQILRADANALLLQLPKNAICFVSEKQDVPGLEVAHGLHQSCIPAGRLARVMAIRMKVR